MADLPTNFKDDILDTSVNTRRRYRVYENTDGTIELEDVTEYSQVGDEFGAGQINATNTEVNKKFDKNMIVRDLDTINAITKEGYVPDALALKEANESLGLFNKLLWTNDNVTTSRKAFNVSLDLSQFKAVMILFCANNSTSANILTTITPIGYKGTVNRTAYYNSSFMAISRDFTVNESGVSFTDCTSNGSSNSGNNIPYKIYGIK